MCKEKAVIYCEIKFPDLIYIYISISAVITSVFTFSAGL